MSKYWQDLNCLFKNFRRDLCRWTPWSDFTLPNLAFAARAGLGSGPDRPLAQFYLMFRQLSPVQDCSLISFWFMICRSEGSTFFTMFSSWWGSDVRLYTSTNDCKRSQRKFTEVQLKVWSTTAHLTDMCSPRCLRTRSTAGLHPSEFWRRRTCCWRRLHIRSLGSIPRRKRKRHLVLQEIRRGWWENASRHRRTIFASTKNLS